MTDSVAIFWSDADQAFIAVAPDLGSCSADREPPAEALRDVQIPQEMWLKVARDHGRSLCEPRFRPALQQLSS